MEHYAVYYGAMLLKLIGSIQLRFHMFQFESVCNALHRVMYCQLNWRTKSNKRMAISAKCKGSLCKPHDNLSLSLSVISICRREI